MTIKIDFVSDLSCPWCAIGLSGLLHALDRLRPELEATIAFQPFELNPGMAPGGQDLDEHLMQKYGSTPEQLAATRQMLRERGLEVGFEFGERRRIHNSFNAHRLLHWTGAEHPEHQLRLKAALLQACHRDGLPLDADDVLLAAVESAGLDRERAIDILAGDEFASAVRERETFYLNAGVRSVPTMIVAGRYAIAGCRGVDELEQALRSIAADIGRAEKIEPQ